MLRYIVLCVNDLEKMSNFYSSMLGYDIKNRFETDNSNPELKDATGLKDLRARGVEIETGTGVDLILCEYEQKADHADEPPAGVNSPGYRQLAFSVTDLDSICTKLKTAGYNFFSKPVTIRISADTGYKFVKVYDPEGNIIELDQF